MPSTVNKRCVVYILATHVHSQTLSLKFRWSLLKKGYNMLNNTKNLRWYWTLLNRLNGGISFLNTSTAVSETTIEVKVNMSLINGRLYIQFHKVCFVVKFCMIKMEVWFKHIVHIKYYMLWYFVVIKYVFEIDKGHQNKSNDAFNCEFLVQIA